MKTIIVTDIVYNFDGKHIDPYTLPVDMVFVVDNNFNKYVEVAQLIKKQTSFLPKSYIVKIDDNVQKYTHSDDLNILSPRTVSDSEIH
jgi:hypothetical protein